MTDNRKKTIQWLYILLYLQIAVLVLSLLDYIPINTSLFQWLKRLCNASSLVCLFMLAAAGKRYMRAAILGSVQFILSLSQAVMQFLIQLLLLQGMIGTEDITKYSDIPAALNLVAMVAGIIYTYQLYHAHGDLIRDLDATLSRKWGCLFVWYLAAGILTTVASMIFATVYKNWGLNSTTVISMFYTLIAVPGQVIILISIIYLNRTIQVIENQEEYTYGN